MLSIGFSGLLPKNTTQPNLTYCYPLASLVLPKNTTQPNLLLSLGFYGLLPKKIKQHNTTQPNLTTTNLTFCYPLASLINLLSKRMAHLQVLAIWHVASEVVFTTLLKPTVFTMLLWWQIIWWWWLQAIKHPCCYLRLETHISGKYNDESTWLQPYNT